jgi:hypothetical protein
MRKKPSSCEASRLVDANSVDTEPIWWPSIEVLTCRSHTVIPVEIPRAPGPPEAIAVVIKSERRANDAAYNEVMRYEHPRRAISVLVIPVINTRHALLEQS